MLWCSICSCSESSSSTSALLLACSGRWNHNLYRPRHNLLLPARGQVVGWLMPQQQAGISQGRICSENCACCHTQIEAADQTRCLAKSQFAETGPTSPRVDPTTLCACQGRHMHQCLSHWYDSKDPRQKAGIEAWGRYHGGRRPSSDDSFHSLTVIPPSALDKPSITKRYHRRRMCSHTSPRRSPTMVTLHDTRFVECRWWNDGWTVVT